MVELGMLIDLSHCTPPARQRIYDIVGQRAPLLMTHVGAYAVNPDPYNPQDWELKKIADSGGMVGRDLHALLADAPRQQAGHQQHRADAAPLRRRGRRRACGHRQRLRRLHRSARRPARRQPFLGRLTQRLLAERFTPQQISQIWGGNALRVLRQGWGRESRQRRALICRYLLTRVTLGFVRARAVFRQTVE
jgi:microsomal dipeptidase-like Zn-dependent dipeptidase